MELNKKERIVLIFSILALILGVGTFAYHFLEGWNYRTAFYFSVTTLSTVGYGDLHPTHDASRLFTSLYIIFGTAIMLAALGELGSYYLDYRKEKLAKIKKKRIEKKRN